MGTLVKILLIIAGGVLGFISAQIDCNRWARREAKEMEKHSEYINAISKVGTISSYYALSGLSGNHNRNDESNLTDSHEAKDGDKE